jgi:hypothetical protein
VTNPIARFLSLKGPARLRAAGRAVLALGILSACVFYLVASHPAERSMDDLLPGYTRSENRQIGALMGNFGVTMLDLEEQLRQPGAEAILIAIVAAIVAGLCYQAAAVREHNAQFEVRANPDDA